MADLILHDLINLRSFKERKMVREADYLTDRISRNLIGKFSDLGPISDPLMMIEKIVHQLSKSLRIHEHAELNFTSTGDSDTKICFTESISPDKKLPSHQYSAILTLKINTESKKKSTFVTQLVPLNEFHLNSQAHIKVPNETYVYFRIDGATQKVCINLNCYDMALRSGISMKVSSQNVVENDMYQIGDTIIHIKEVSSTTLTVDINNLSTTIDSNTPEIRPGLKLEKRNKLWIIESSNEPILFNLRHDENIFLPSGALLFWDDLTMKISYTYQ